MYLPYFLGIIGKRFLKKTLEKRYICQKRRKIKSKLLKIKPKRYKSHTNGADEHYGNANAIEIIKDVKDVEFIHEMNLFVRYSFFKKCCVPLLTMISYNQQNI